MSFVNFSHLSSKSRRKRPQVTSAPQKQRKEAIIFFQNVMFPFFFYFTFISFEVSFLCLLPYFFFLLRELHLEFYHFLFHCSPYDVFGYILDHVLVFGCINLMYTSDFWLFINKIKVHGFYCRFNLSVS